MRRRLILPVLAVVALGALFGDRSAGATPQLKDRLVVDLVAESTSAQPGTSLLVGLKFEIEEHWHIYWENPGDAGFPTGVTWTLPEGWKASPILWPAPRLFLTGDLAGFGYEGAFVLPVRIDIPADAPAKTFTITAEAEWLVCHEECIPGDADLKLDVLVAPALPKPGSDQKLFDAAKALWPKALVPAQGAARALARGVQLILSGAGPWNDPSANVFLFALEDGTGAGKKQVVEPAAKQVVTREEGRTLLRLELPKKRKSPPERLVGILRVETAKETQAFAVDVPVAAEAEAGVGPGGAVVPDGGGEQPPAEVPTPLWLLLLGALVGGIVLNIMPCVLPVLSIKILGFVSMADEHPAQVRRHAYAFAIGVLASFWFLAGLILAIRAGGEELGWGFHFQSPIFVVSMAALMFIVAMNLAGVFEIGLSVQSLAGDAANKIHGSGYAASFWSGALATVIATPCTAPMMGPAVGYAMAAPVIHCLLVFTFLGIGMALPYVLLSMSPRLLRKVPRPGPWMETFKHALCFPMFATVIWLGSVINGQLGGSSVVWMFASLLTLGLALWIYGHWGTPSTGRRLRWGVGYLLAALVALGAVRLMDRALAGDTPGLIHWEPWSKERVIQEVAKGNVVFVDFTADWCTSCKVNEAAFIEVEAVRDAVKKTGAVMLRADWTRKDDAIRLGLKEFGRRGVPLYLAYPPIPGKPPEILPEVLTSSSQIVGGLERAAAQAPPSR